MKEVSIIRVPDQMSLEMTEPISISRQWEDQLHYDIIISGKSFPIGGRIPIAFKLTPLAKVQVHKLKVYLTESIEYWTNDRRVTRKDPGRKVLLLEKSAGKPLAENWASSDIRATRGGELSPEQRAAAREQATRRRMQEASRRGVAPEPLPQPAENLLGDLDLGLENLWGSTEIEANVQIPTCQMMARNRELRLNADCSWKNVNVYHWIKVVMRISRLDPEDPTGTKRRHFEISIDSPFTVLNCRATQANTNLPAYTGNEHQPMTCQTSCGCPDAQSVPTELPQEAPTTLVGAGRSAEDLPMPPQAARLANGAANPASQQQGSPTMPQGACTRGARPMHLIRAPSFCPPDIDDDDSPPPLTPLMINTDIPAFVPSLISPPPQYDVVVGTPSVDGMADYFTRLAHYGFEDQDSSGSDDDTAPPRILDRSGRVNVAHPRSPIGRMPSRSMELSRPNLGLNIANIAT
uniref:Arrestin C-terminal-like domain-containing protein n=1 Tax=Bionectria ochroleuca TaxID=29856 RepID=A0A8H7TTM3_BIOOC